MPPLTITTATPAQERLLSLDVIRGIALCGIAFVNITQLWMMFPASTQDSIAWTLRNLLAHERFFPVFTFLFGIGFAMIVRSARRRQRREWVVLLRRLIPLLILGFLHALVHPGEALMHYAFSSLIFLLPLTFLPETRRLPIATVLGVILTLIGVYFGGTLLIPGLLLLGFAAAEWGLPQRLDINPRPAALALLLLVPLTLVTGFLQYQDRARAGFTPLSSVAGFILAATWVALVLVMLRTPLRDALAAVFAPLGRMALTNYIGATFIILAARPLLGIPPAQDNASDADFVTAWLVVIVMLIAQAVISTVWLRAFGQGPLEKAWRWLTWDAFGSRSGAHAA